MNLHMDTDFKATPKTKQNMHMTSTLKNKCSITQKYFIFLKHDRKIKIKIKHSH